MTEEIVSENDVTRSLEKLRELRAWAAEQKIGPWAFRQSLIITLEIDTQVAIENGVESVAITNFDNLSKQSAREFVKGFARNTDN